MRRILIALFCFGLLFNVTAQDTVTDSDTEKLIDKYSEKISATVTSLAETLKQPATHVYGLLVRQQVLKSWIFLSASSIFWLLGGFMIILRWFSKEKEDGWFVACAIFTGMGS